MPSDPSLIRALLDGGVIIHAPESVYLREIDPSRIESGVELYPGVTLEGGKTLLRRGTCLGKAGGGFFSNIQTGFGVELYSGYFEEATFLDGVKIRGHAEVRGGTLLEEGCEAAHHVGYKMTIAMPYVIAGSLINFCDVFISGGRSRQEHSEIGSALALYNFTPHGDKFASLLGDVPRGLFLREDPIFIGGQTQIISPVEIGYGTVIPAGCSVRRSVPDHRIYGEPKLSIDRPWNPRRYGDVVKKYELTLKYIAQMWALRLWYERVRRKVARDPMEAELYEMGQRRIEAHIRERMVRLDKWIQKFRISMREYEARDERYQKQREILEHWPEVQKRLKREPELHSGEEVFEALVRDWNQKRNRNQRLTYIEWIKSIRPEPVQGVLEKYIAAALRTWTTL